LKKSYNEKYKEVWDKLVLTHHGKDNLNERRSDIPLKDVVECIIKGQYGFAGGGGRYKKTYKNTEVVYKESSDQKLVVITYYRVKQHKKKDIFQLFEQISKSS